MTAQLAVCTLLALAPGAAPPSAPAWAIDFGLTDAQLRAAIASRTAAGFCPTCVSGNNLNQETRYAVVWEKVKGPAWKLDYGITPAQLERRGVTLKRDGFRPVSLCGFDLIGDQGFIDLWRKAGGPEWSVEYGKDADGLTRLAADMKTAGFRPVAVSSYVSGAVNRFATIWEKGGDVDWLMKWGLAPAAFETTLTNLTNLGYRPVAISGLGVLEDVALSAVWVKQKGPAWVMRYNQDAEGLKTLGLLMRQKGFRPVYLSGYQTGRGVRYASIWEQDAAK
jgi:hypothetical protein